VGVTEIWLHDPTRGTSSRFTFGALNASGPFWSPDGRCLAYDVGTGGGLTQTALHAKPASGAGTEEVLLTSFNFKSLQDWSRDGRSLVYREFDPGNNRGDLWILPLTPPRPGGCPAAAGSPIRYLQTPFDESGARISPDGRWLAYASDETRRSEVYVQSFPAPGSKYQISTGGGILPVWSRDRKELFYISTGRELMAVSVEETSGARFVAGTPKIQFQLPVMSVPGYDVSPDGKRFLMTPLQTDAAIPPISVVLNWHAGVKK
jgi:Tol biopolymer transport system component